VQPARQRSRRALSDIARSKRVQINMDVLAMTSAFLVPAFFGRQNEAAIAGRGRMAVADMGLTARAAIAPGGSGPSSPGRRESLT